MPRRSSCCTPAENSQLTMRFPKPRSKSGSYCSAGRVEPNVPGDVGPHSPFAIGLVNSQSGTKLVLLSLHDRVAELTSAFTGFGLDPSVFSVWPSRYLLKVTLMAVLPSPRRSYASPVR